MASIKTYAKLHAVGAIYELPLRENLSFQLLNLLEKSLTPHP
jgi:hypothetical protein